MKAPKPAIPEFAPPGIVWFGGPIEWFSITLRILSEDLVPDDLTARLRASGALSFGRATTVDIGERRTTILSTIVPLEWSTLPTRRPRLRGAYS